MKKDMTLFYSIYKFYSSFTNIKQATENYILFESNRVSIARLVVQLVPMYISKLPMVNEL